jgi:hypothetical protein
MAFLEDLMNRDESFEGLDLVGEDGLAIGGTRPDQQGFDLVLIVRRWNLHLHPSPEGLAGLVVPCVDDATADMFSFGSCFFGTGGLLDVDGQLGLGPGLVSNGDILVLSHISMFVTID